MCLQSNGKHNRQVKPFYTNSICFFILYETIINKKKKQEDDI